MTTFSTSRQLAATPTEVFAAISDAQRLARWWGPKGFTNRFELFEFHEGGRWVFDMIAPNGATYPNEAVFSSIDVGSRVVIDHVCEPHFKLTITLEPSAAGTLLRWDQAFADATVARKLQHIVEPANEQNLDRLNHELGLT